jgi:hypothetical protein
VNLPHSLPLELVIVFSHATILPRGSCPAKLDHLIKVKYEVGCPPPAHTTELLGNITIDADLLSAGSPQLLSNQNNELCTYDREFTYKMKNRLSQSIGTGFTSYRARLTWNNQFVQKNGEGFATRATINGTGPCP